MQSLKTVLSRVHSSEEWGNLDCLSASTFFTPETWTAVSQMFCSAHHRQISFARSFHLFFHLFGDSSHELAPWVHLQKLWPSQRPAFVNFLKTPRHFSRVFRSQGFSFFETAGHIDDSQSVFVCFPARPRPTVSCRRKGMSAWWMAFGVDEEFLERGMYFGAGR